MNEPSLISQDALSGRRIALSVSESLDLARLGLTEQHCRLVVAEVGRAIMLAGGTVMYGGDLRSGGYTEILIEEAQRFGGGMPVLEITLAESVYRKLDGETLIAADRNLGGVGRLILVSESGYLVPTSDALTEAPSPDAAVALTAMRGYVARTSAARLIVGGRLSGYSGAEPGVIEEARLTIHAGRPLLAAGGYGGAAAAVAQRLRPQDFRSWVPDDYPCHAHDPEVARALDELSDANARAGANDMFDEELLHLLTISHRPADIARATVRLLSGLVTETDDQGDYCPPFGD